MKRPKNYLKLDRNSKPSVPTTAFKTAKT